MNKFITLIACIFTMQYINAQDLAFDNFEWKENPKLHELSEEEAKLPEINIFKEVVNEYAFEGDQFFSFYFMHKIVKVNSDDAIESNNKIYIPLGRTLDVLETKARVINSKGKIIELDESDVKEAQDEESKVNYKYFALKGIDIGSEIEFYYLLKEPAELTGERIKFQSEVPNKKVKFSLISPYHLGFIFKSYNGFPEVQKDSLYEDKNRWYAEIDDLPALKEEDMSAYESNLQSVIYKLDYNSASGKRNLYTYSTVAQNYYANITAEIEKKTAKKIQKLLKNSEVDSQENDEKKIRTLEQYLKTNFSYQSFSHPNLKDLDFILENKIASKTGLMKLYAACLNNLNIDYQLVLTSNRYSNKFDKDFESFSFLTEELIYITKLKKYLSPTAIFSRLGYIPSSWTNNNALFIKPVSLGEYSSAVGKIKMIKPLPHEANSDTLDIEINFEDISKPEISFHKSQHGLEVLSVQPLYDFIDGENEEEVDENIAKFINSDVEVEDIEIENKGGENFGVKAFKVSAKLVDTDVFVEKAGTKYLFKIGELIGPQMEMYQEKGQERKLDVEVPYNHSYYRTITFNIPEGYQIKNLDELRFNVSFEYEGKKSAFFESSYTIKGNKVVFKNEEVYDDIFYPKDSFESYQKVINAAADFNKVTLVIEKI